MEAVGVLQNGGAGRSGESLFSLLAVYRTHFLVRVSPLSAKRQAAVVVGLRDVNVRAGVLVDVGQIDEQLESPWDLAPGVWKKCQESLEPIVLLKYTINVGDPGKACLVSSDHNDPSTRMMVAYRGQ